MINVSFLKINEWTQRERLGAIYDFAYTKSYNKDKY